MFRCQESYRDGSHCQEPAYAYEKYCRWHLILHRFLGGEGKPWHKPFGVFMLLLWARHALTLISQFCKVVNTPDLESFFRLCDSLCWCSFGISTGIIFVGLRHLIWPKVLSVSLLVLTVLYAIFAVIAVLGPDYADLITLTTMNPNIPFPHYSLVALTSAIVAAYFGLVFLHVVLFVSTTWWVYVLVFSLYALFWALSAFFVHAPLVPLTFFLLLIALLLNQAFDWVGKVRDWIDSCRF
jgi:hypothetical protein